MKPAIEKSTWNTITVAIVVVFVGGLIAGEVAYRVNTARDISAIRSDVQTIKTESWLRSHMRLWVSETESRNRGQWQAAPVQSTAP